MIFRDRHFEGWKTVIKLEYEDEINYRSRN